MMDRRCDVFFCKNKATYDVPIGGNVTLPLCDDHASMCSDGPREVHYDTAGKLYIRRKPEGKPR